MFCRVSISFLLHLWCWSGNLCVEIFCRMSVLFPFYMHFCVTIIESFGDEIFGVKVMVANSQIFCQVESFDDEIVGVKILVPNSKISFLSEWLKNWPLVYFLKFHPFRRVKIDHRSITVTHSCRSLSTASISNNNKLANRNPVVISLTHFLDSLHRVLELWVGWWSKR